MKKIIRTHFLKHFGTAVLFLVPLAPLVVYLGFLFPYMSGRNFFFRTLVLTAFACWLVLWIQSPERYRPRSSFLVWAVLAFIATVGIATAFAPYPALAFWSNLERMDGLVGVLFLAMFFFSALHLLDAKSWKIFFHISIGTALVVSAIALFQLVGVFSTHQGALRIDATLGNPSFFAAYMLLSAGLALFLSSSALKRRRRLLYISCAGLFLFLALASGTRSAFVALPVSLFFCGSAAFLLRKDNANLKRFGVATLAALALFASLFFALRQVPSLSSHPLVGRLLSVSLTGADAQARFLSWNMALKGASERPLFGWGPEGFRSVFVKYYDPRLYGREQWFDRAHNTYLDWLVQAGGIGLFAYLALWFGLARAVWRISVFSAWEKVALSGMFAGYAAFNIFSFDTITASIIFFSFLAFTESRSERRQGVLTNTPLFSKRACRSSLTALIVLVAVFVFYVAIAKPALAARAINLGLRSPSQNLDDHLKYFTRSISLNSFATAEAREMLAKFAVEVAGQPLREESRAKIVALAVQELSRQIEVSPDNPFYPLRLGTVLNVYRQYAAAAPFLEQAVALSPQKQPSFYELGTSYLNLKQFDKAVTVFKRAADVLPDNEDMESKKLYAVSLVYARRFAEAESYMKKIFGVPVFSGQQLSDAYQYTGQYGKMIEVLRYSISVNPQDGLHYFKLAGALLLGGHSKTEAIAEIRKGMEKDSSLVPAGEEYIRRLEAGERNVK